MPVEMLTYAGLGERLKISPEAARALVKRQRLPRSRSNDGKTLVQVDLTEITHSPVSRGPQAQAGHQVVTALNQKIETLQAELIEMEAIASGHRADFERECERTNKLLAELLKASAQTMASREKAALLEGKLSVLTLPWRRRLAMLSPLPSPKRPPSRARASDALPDNQTRLGHWPSGGILKALGNLKAFGNLRDRGTAAAGGLGGQPSG
ncbi:hypothetical protein [Bradyrhizobium canariense]|uniref:Uncharacterized protein n=1 Tax=Bradyrhizobium canariense TaxID=255045 RepID=A0A1H1QQG6_9BRAD|nr:hypothetical protein [Bradyrhizobium canariense]SDS25636.1 hypothetical protein SAMN05444158_1493 [Bradyrhizobium canariense]